MHNSNQKIMKVRDSNMELLRITAMLLVLIVHASFLSLGAPASSDFQVAPTNTFFRLFSKFLGETAPKLFR